MGGEAGLSWAVGDLQFTAAAGARRLSPDTAAPRTAATYRGRASWRPVPRFGVSVGYARAPFDEIASLMERELDLESVDAGLDATLARGLSIYGGGGGVWFSDGNHRTNAWLGVTQSLPKRFFVGAYGRTLAYERRGLGYFSPDRFRLLEGLAGYNLETPAAGTDGSAAGSARSRSGAAAWRRASGTWRRGSGGGGAWAIGSTSSGR